MITWQASDVSTSLEVLGYQLLMDDGLGDDAELKAIFDTGNNPQVTSYLVENLRAGLTYRFQVKARDVNGLGDGGPIGSFVACLVPNQVELPVLDSVAEQ